MWATFRTIRGIVDAVLDKGDCSLFYWTKWIAEKTTKKTKTLCPGYEMTIVDGMPPPILFSKLKGNPCKNPCKTKPSCKKREHVLPRISDSYKWRAIVTILPNPRMDFWSPPATSS